MEPLVTANIVAESIRATRSNFGQVSASINEVLNFLAWNLADRLEARNNSFDPEAFVNATHERITITERN